MGKGGGKLLLSCSGKYMRRWSLPDTHNDINTGIALDPAIQLPGIDPKMMPG